MSKITVNASHKCNLCEALETFKPEKLLIKNPKTLTSSAKRMMEFAIPNLVLTRLVHLIEQQSKNLLGGLRRVKWELETVF